MSNTTTATYDNGGRRSTQTDPRGQTTQFAYNANNNLTTITDPLNHATSYTYDAVGNKIAVSDVNGNLRLSSAFGFSMTVDMADSESPSGFVISLQGGGESDIELEPPDCPF